MTIRRDRKSTRLNSSHTVISYAVFCLKKKEQDRLAGNLADGLGDPFFPVCLHEESLSFIVPTSNPAGESAARSHFDLVPQKLRHRMRPQRRHDLLQGRADVPGLVAHHGEP